MLNMVVPEDSVDDDEYAEILDDIRDECSSFGRIEDVRVPRPVKKDKSKWSAADAAKADEAASVGRVRPTQIANRLSHVEGAVCEQC